MEFSDVTESRPFFSRSIAELEAAFEERQSEPDFLIALDAELQHRRSERASRLSGRIRSLTASASLPIEPHPPMARPEVADRADPPEPVTRVDAPMPPVTDKPVEILSAWTALEVLNPQTFAKPQDLASKGERGLVADLTKGLPWTRGEPGQRKKKLFYHVVLGTIDAPRAFDALLERFVDGRPERPRPKAEAVLATIIVDTSGVPIRKDAVGVSSFGWGLPIALTGHLAELSGWSTAERALQIALDHKLRRQDEHGADVPLDQDVIQSAYAWLLTELELLPQYTRPPRFAIRQFQDFRLKEPPDPLVLNSFYLGDLARARARFADSTAPKALRLYLGHDRPANRRDLLNDNSALEAAIAPSQMPLARWPSAGRHPLVLLQQAAVNLALANASEPGLVAVNGPPGTGKTTLLRDVVASLVMQRAEAMCHFDAPSTAFTDTGERIRLGAEEAHLFRLDPTVRGFEIVVASSNNKAVENVSAELPAESAVADDAGLSYFKPLSDALLGRPTWGLIAAVLGKMANKAKFRNTFWWDAEIGLSTYLAEAAGTPQWIDEVHADETVTRRKPRLIIEASAPSSKSEAIANWQAARAAFRKRLADASELRAGLHEIRSAMINLPSLAAKVISTGQALDSAKAAAARLNAQLHAADINDRTAREVLTRAQNALAAHDANKPALLAVLFFSRKAREWVSLRAPLHAAHESAVAARTASAAVRDRLETEWRASEATAKHRMEEANAAQIARASAQQVHESGKARLAARLVNAEYFLQEHEAKHQSVPWCDAVDHRLRDDLFVAAMAVHKAFVDAAAKPIRGNLSGLMKSMGPTGTGAFSGRKSQLLQEAWATLFLVVPLVSTTFASVERMLGKLPAEALGWLLIDEAGQASPQAAVGAIMRVRRAIVVGDPMQIEPVVPLPATLTQTICRRFGVDPDRFNAPEASTQTLADFGTAYMAEFQGRHGSRTVGVPLLVHRRCAEPMFGIANAVGYQRLMVQAKAPKSSAIRDCLGPSRWIDVQGSGRDKWCEEEGEVIFGLLRRLGEANVPLNLYLVSPFRLVAENIQRLLLDRGVLMGLTPDPRQWIKERVGTVHTVQGREAEAVIFVLGAPEIDQSGARNWAGRGPNLLNVAVTRAQEVVYVVGNRRQWREAGVFAALDSGLTQ